MKTIVVGLGNPILGDDGVGWQVAGQVAAGLQQSHNRDAATCPVEVDCLAVGGLSLMERLAGYDRAILIDAISTGLEPAGTVSCLPLESLPEWPPGHSASAHDTSLQNALRVGRSSGVPLPGSITVISVEVQSLFEFSEELSEPVADAIPCAVKMVLDQLEAISRPGKD